MIFILTMGAMRTKSSSSIITDLKLGCFKNYMRPGPSPRDSDLIGPRGPRSLYSEIVLQVIISLSLLRIIFHDIQRPGGFSRPGRDNGNFAAAEHLPSCL